MPTVILEKSKEPKHGADVRSKIYTFLNKLSEDDTTPGLHIEPIANSADPRARTGRVDLYWRAVLFRIDPEDGERAYVYAGTWPHDEGTERAKNLILAVNPVNGLAEVRHAPPSDEPAAVTAPVVAPEEERVPFLAAQQYLLTDLTDELGFDADTAARAFAAADEDGLLALAMSLDSAWQADALVEMGAGTAVHEIKEKLGISEPAPVAEQVDEDQQLLDALKHPAARMQFTFIEDDEELRRMIEDGDFGAWRVFLHPEQQRYVDRQGSGPFRLTGGAGTGKTVVLLHRARRLAKVNPGARIVLTTYTRALAENLRRDLERLDDSIPFAAKLGDPGVLVRGVDQLANEVRARAGAEYAAAAQAVIGSPRESSAGYGSADWDTAIRQVGADLPMALRSSDFFADEYAQIVLPNGITQAEDYFTVRRAGRGVALDRAKRAVVWKVIEQARKDQRIANALDFGEVAAISARWLADSGATFADHVLIDEAQDLEPAKWRLLRAIVPSGPDDLFIADDTHQRIYGHPTVLKRYDISVQGRSRRLTLNYRTTLENLRYAMGILSGVDYSGAQDEDVTTAGYRSSRSGPVPRVHATKSDMAQLDAIAADVKRWIDEGVRPDTIAILAASKASAKKVQQGLEARGVSVALAGGTRTPDGQPLVMTMHGAKGLEFSRVVLFDISDGSFPVPATLKGVLDEDRPDKLKQQRSLLYVAASRARDELVVTWKGSPSELLVR